MSHTDLAHQYFTSKPNLLRMTTYHRQDMSFTAATFTFSVFSIYAHPHRHTHAHTYTQVHTYMHIDCCVCFFAIFHLLLTNTLETLTHTHCTWTCILLWNRDIFLHVCYEHMYLKCKCKTPTPLFRLSYNF